MTPYARIRLIAFGIDGTLTDATTWWAGEGIGWVQRYSVRDDEALLRLKSRMPVLPLSKNATTAARERMAGLGLDGRWLGVTDKPSSLRQICRQYLVDPAEVLFVGDGPDDAHVFLLVGIGCAVADAHPAALRTAHIVLERRGGDRVIEEVEQRLEEGRR
jgi:3-deoxy-D-manno-octulosonate 8-phosphate phosphatase (KDO 8-P phosphatase)